MKNFYKFIVALGFLLTGPSFYLFSQVGINTNNDAPDPAAMLDVKSTDKGFLPPRMTTEQMNSVVAPPAGLLVYNTAVNSLFWFNGSAWKRFIDTNTETDPIFGAHPASGISTVNIGNWNTAFGWGNHATAGYLKSYTETDPIFGAHPASGITDGNITNWNTAFTNRITTANGTAPLSLTISANQLIGSITAANPLTNGYLTSVDWNTFNNKQNALALGNATSADLAINGGNGAIIGGGMTISVNKGNLTEATSAVLAISGGTGAVLGSGASVQVKQAGASQAGYLGSGDWNSFNNKVSSQWTANGLKLHYNTGNVGIGTTNPQSKVDIAGNAVIGSSYSGTNAAPVNGLLVEGKVGIGTSMPVSSAVLEVASTSGGVLLPRMTHDQRFAIPAPAEGLMVFCTNCGSNGALSVYSNGAWRTFIPCSCSPPTAGINALSPGQIIWNWNPVAGAVGYKWNTATNYGSALEMNTATLKAETGISCGTTYTRYVWAYNECEISVPAALTQTVSAIVPLPPTTGTHTATQTSIVWNWNTVADAIGYKWNTVNVYATAAEMAAATTKTETGLACGTPYTRYVWAYNGCGWSLATALNQSTGPCVVLPTVTTATTTSIAQTSATSGGNVTWDGGGTVTERGVCYGTSPNPTISGSKTIDGGGPGVFTSYLSALSPNTPYYAKAYATNSVGTAYGDQVSFTTLAFAIGQTYGGGIIFYIDGTGLHGLISATTDQSASAQWGCYGTSIPGTSTAIGTGQANTTIIVNGCSEAGRAARICNDLSLNGYDDWFLPSKDELNQMYAQKTVIGGFTTNYYWSSSEYNANYAWLQYFYIGIQTNSIKLNAGYVRAVRAF